MTLCHDRDFYGCPSVEWSLRLQSDMKSKMLDNRCEWGSGSDIKCSTRIQTHKHTPHTNTSTYNQNFKYCLKDNIAYQFNAIRTINLCFHIYHYHIYAECYLLLYPLYKSSTSSLSALSFGGEIKITTTTTRYAIILQSLVTNWCIKFLKILILR